MYISFSNFLPKAPADRICPMLDKSYYLNQKWKGTGSPSVIPPSWWASIGRALIWSQFCPQDFRWNHSLLVVPYSWSEITCREHRPKVCSSQSVTGAGASNIFERLSIFFKNLVQYQKWQWGWLSKYFSAISSPILFYLIFISGHDLNCRDLKWRASNQVPRLCCEIVFNNAGFFSRLSVTIYLKEIHFTVERANPLCKKALLCIQNSCITCKLLFQENKSLVHLGSISSHVWYY